MMFKLKTGRLDIKSFALSKQLFGAQQVRLQTNAAAARETEPNVEPNNEWTQARPFEEIPTATIFQMFRHFLPGGNYFKMDSNQLMFGLKRDFGDIFVWPAMMGNPQTLFTHNPHDFERVFRNEGVWPNRPGMDTLKHHRSELRGEFFQGVEGVLSTQGEKWGTFRSAVNPVLMQPKNVKLYLNKMSTVNWEFVERIKEIRDTETLEVPDTFEEEINRWTLESVSVVALDKKLNLLKENRDNPEAKQLFQSLADQFKLTFELEFQPSLWKYISTPKYKRLMKALDNIQVITSTFVNEAIERLESERKAGGVEKPESEKSVLEKLLKMDKNIGMVMAMDMLMAGVDTTSTTFTGIMLCLAKNPEKQEKLREEILRILPEKNSKFTESSLKNMPYLRACIKEALRMYPLGLGNGRVLQNDVVLNGYQVPKDTTVIMVSATLMRNEQHYPRANEFLPERWLRQPTDHKAASECPNALKASSPFIYLPFGFGPRSCIGKRIVELELELGVSRIIRNFKVEFNYPTEKAFKSLLINVPNIPLKFKFTDI